MPSRVEGVAHGGHLNLRPEVAVEGSVPEMQSPPLDLRAVIRAPLPTHKKEKDQSTEKDQTAFGEKRALTWRMQLR